MLWFPFQSHPTLEFYPMGCETFFRRFYLQNPRNFVENSILERIICSNKKTPILLVDKNCLCAWTKTPPSGHRQNVVCHCHSNKNLFESFGCVQIAVRWIVVLFTYRVSVKCRLSNMQANFFFHLHIRIVYQHLFLSSTWVQTSWSELKHCHVSKRSLAKTNTINRQLLCFKPLHSSCQIELLYFWLSKIVLLCDN